jgi:hypothetical protein
MLIIFVDADACPVKDEVYKVARRYRMHVAVVANTALRVPADSLIELVVCPGFGAADHSPSRSGRATSSSPQTSPWLHAAWPRKPVSSTRKAGRSRTTTLGRRWQCVT